MTLRNVGTGTHLDVEGAVVRARWDDPGIWQRFEVVDASGAGGGGDSGGGLALVAHTGCFLECSHDAAGDLLECSHDAAGDGGGGDGGGGCSGGGQSAPGLTAVAQRATEYGPRAPSPGQIFAVQPIDGASGGDASGEGVFCVVVSGDGRWLLAAGTTNATPRPAAFLVPNTEAQRDSAACRWRVSSPSNGLAPLRCGFVLPIADTAAAAGAATGTGESSSGSASRTRASHFMWFGVCARVAYVTDCSLPCGPSRACHPYHLLPCNIHQLCVIFLIVDCKAAARTSPTKTASALPRFTSGPAP